MNQIEVYSEEELYPKQIATILAEAGIIVDDESSMIEEYLWSTKKEVTVYESF